MREEALFHEALAQKTPHAREMFLAEACAGNLKLRADVASLIRAHEESNGFLAPFLNAGLDNDCTHASAEPSSERGKALAQDTQGQARSTNVIPGRPGVAVKLPSQIGRYEIRQELGRGGMGTVYLAHDPELDRLIALKVPQLNGPAAQERFLRESRAAAALTHPNLCPVFDAGRADGALYLAMAYVPGSSLSQVLRQAGPLPVARATAIATGIARGMAEAHRHGIVHRDLKPGNILFDRRGEPVVTDFGLAYRGVVGDVDRGLPAAGATDLKLTQTGALMGTPSYMPPEQAQGDFDKIGPTSDVYALGAILFEMLTGKTPFQATSIGEMIRKINNEPVPAMPGIPAGLETICRKALAKDSAERIPSMEAFIAELAAVDAARRARTRTRICLAVAAGVLLLFTGVIVTVMTNNGIVEVRLSDPAADVRVQVDGEIVKLNDHGRITRLRAGTHALEVQGEDFELETKLFKVRRGDKLVLEVELKPKNTGATLPSPTRLKSPEQIRLAEHLQRGRKMLEESRLDEVAKAADGVLEIDPQSPGGLALRAMCRASAGEKDGALADAEAALALDPEIREALLVRAIVHGENGDFEEAIADESVAIRLAPDHPRAWSNRSKSYLDRKDYAQSVADATRAIELKLGGPDALLCRAGAYACLGDYKQALADFDEAARLAPNNWQVFDRRSALHAKLGNDKQEKADWAKTTELKPAARIEDRVAFIDPPQTPERRKLSAELTSQLTVALNQALGAWNQGRFADCQTATDTAFQIDPTSGLARAWRARMLATGGRFDEAVVEASESLRHDPAVSWSFVTRGVARLNLGKSAAGIADLTIALTSTPQEWTAWYNRGLAYMERGQFQQALADYTQALRHSPNQPDAFVNRGVCYLSLGDYKSALAEYDRAISGQPANARWRLIRSAIRAKLGDPDGARQDRDEAIRIDGTLKNLPEITLPVPRPPAKVDPQTD